MKTIKIFMCLLFTFILSLSPTLTTKAWTSSTHVKQLESSGYYAKLTANERKLMAECAKFPDSHFTQGYNSIGHQLHGSGNYVLNLRFLYTVAYHFNNGDSNAIVTTKNELSNCNLAEIEKNMIPAINKILNTDVVKDLAEKSNRMRAIKTLGLAMHLAGDMYAHYTIIPANSINMFDKNTLTYPDKGIHGFNNWNDFKNAVATGTTIFKLIPGGNYEDNTNFFPSRYNNATKHTTNKLLKNFTENSEWGLTIVLPWLGTGDFKHNGTRMKMNKLQDYIVGAGYGKTYTERKYNLSLSDISVPYN